jgi:Uma2 family endonuclease
MTTATLPAPKTATPMRPFRWTVTAFHNACERKVWGDGKRMILIRGELFEVVPMKPLHATGIMLVGKALMSIVPPDHELRQQLPLVLDLETDPIPDFALVAGDVRDYLKIHPKTAKLVVEIAVSSIAMDMTSKAELYATALVPEYWVLDLDRRVLHVLREPMPIPGNGAAAYRTHLELKADQSVSPLAAPDQSIPVASLLP